MNLYAWLSLSASTVSFVLGLVIYSLNRKKLLNRLFVLTTLAGLWYTFTEFMMWQAGTAEAAQFWNKMGFTWTLFAALTLHFSLVYTGSKWLKHKVTYLALYLPALLFSLTDLTTELITGAPVLRYWGFENTVISSTWVYDVSTFWVALLPIIALLMCAKFYFGTADKTKRQQSKFVTTGLAIPILTYIVTNAVFPPLDIEIPNLGDITLLFFSIFVAYAILKYELFTFDAAMAAENIVSTMPDSLILADMKGKMLKVNRQLVKFLGYKEAELVGESIAKLCADEKRCVKILETLSTERAVRNWELKFRTNSGEEKTVLFSGSVVRSKTGRDIGFTCVIHDITERIKMEERLVKAERLASIGELAGQVGHDLRNPLTGIKGGVYVLRKKGDALAGGDREKVLDLIEDAVEDSNRIVNSLVEHSSDLRLQTAPCTPKTILQQALSKVQVPDRITLIDHLNGVELVLDAAKMEGVFASILRNAVDAIPEEGTIEVRSSQQDSAVEIAFSDSGKGIPQDVLPKVFSPLTTTKAKGMGMGLAICKRVVEAHGGKISVESAVRKGTTFTVALPTKPKDSAAF